MASTTRRLFGLSFAFAKLMTGAIFVLSCAPITEATVEPAVETTLKELTEPDNEDRLNKLLDLHGIENASERFGRGLTQGMITSALLIASEQGFLDNTDGQFQHIMSTFGEQIDEEISPAMVSLAIDITEGVLSVWASPEQRRLAALLATAITEAVLDAIAQGLDGDLGDGVESMIVNHVGPGLAHIIEHNIGPALVDILDDDFNAAAGETARVIARELTLGTTQGLRIVDDVDTETPSMIEELATHTVNISESLGWVFWALVIVFGILAIGLASWAVRLVFEARDIKQKSDAR